MGISDGSAYAEMRDILLHIYANPLINKQQ